MWPKPNAYRPHGENEIKYFRWGDENYMSELLMKCLNYYRIHKFES